MRVLGIVGRSGSGKTTLIERLLPCLRRRGLRVSTIKHSHHRVDLDPPGKDSRRHRDAGAEEVLLVSPHRWALLRETPRPGGDPANGPVPDLAPLLARMAPVDLILVEGFGHVPGPRLEVVRAALAGLPASRPLYLDDPAVAALATDHPVAGWPGPRFELDDAASICVWIAALPTPPPTPPLSWTPG